MINARQAFVAYSTGLPEFVKATEAQVKAGQVGKVFKGDLEKLAKQKKFVEFLTKFNLLSDDPTTAKRGGGVRATYLPEVDKVAAGNATKIKELVKATNAILKEKAPHLHAFCYFKDDRAARKPAVATEATPVTK